MSAEHNSEIAVSQSIFLGIRPILVLMISMALPGADGSTAGFSLIDTAGEYVSVLQDGRTVARYMYAHDTSTPQRREETFTPYIHVFDADGQATITKGPGGWIPYHRGIFVGWKVLGFEGKNIDRIEMKGGEVVHRQFAEQRATSDQVTLTAMIDWNDDHGQPFIVEKRTMVFHRAPAPARLSIDLSCTFTAPRSKVWFGGDWVHNGVQFRGADETVRKDTKFLFPTENANPKTDVDYPWVGMSYDIKRNHDAAPREYSVIQMNKPTNPKGTLYGTDSAARLAVCFNLTLQPNQPVTASYRFIIADGPLPDRQTVQQWSDQYASSVTTPATHP